MRSILVVLVLAGCASNNVAELAGRVRVVAYDTDTVSCQPIGPVSGAGMSLTGARQQAQRHTLFLGGNVVTAGIWVGVTRPGSAMPFDHRGTFSGYAFYCSDGPALASQLTGVTFVPAGQITVSPEKPMGCDQMGPAIEAFSDGRPGSAEDALRRLAQLVEANYVRILKTIEFGGRPALRGQPYACAIQRP